MIAATPGDPAVPSQPTSPRGGPTVLRILLGSQLRRLREQHGMTAEEVGAKIRASHSKISRMELGRVGVRERDLSDLLSLYDVPQDHRRQLHDLLRRANEPAWWHSKDGLLADWFELYLGLEGAATLIRNYEVQFIPGLLQIPEYTRQVVLLGHPEFGTSQVEPRVELRKERQQVLERSDGPRLWAVIDEAALRRPLGGTDVMRAQLDHLIEMVEHDRVTIQVVPFGAGGHAAAGGPFCILRFAQPDLPDVVYLEQLTSAVYLDKRLDVDRYLAVMERLCVDAAPVGETAKTLKRLRKSL